MNKRGSAYDIYYVLIILLIAGITVLVGATVWGEVSTQEDFNQSLYEHNLTARVVAPVDTAIQGFNDLIVAFYILLNVAAIITAFLVRSHPIFFILNVLLMGFFIVGSVIFANVYYEVASISFIASYANNYATMTLLFTYLPIITLVLSSLLAIVMYGKSDSGRGSAYGGY